MSSKRILEKVNPHHDATTTDTMDNDSVSCNVSSSDQASVLTKIPNATETSDVTRMSIDKPGKSVLKRRERVDGSEGVLYV